MRQDLVIVGSCVVLLLVLRLATIGGDSATSFGLVRLPNPTPSPSEECAAFARMWMDSSGSGPGAVTAVSHCRRDASGDWVLAQDARELSFRDAARAASIKGQLARLEATLPSRIAPCPRRYRGNGGHAGQCQIP